MRKLCLYWLAICLALALPSRTLAQEELRAIIDKALKAHGGEEKLTKFKAAMVKSKGTLHVLNGLAFTSEAYAQMPDKIKDVLKFEIMGMNVTQTTVINGDKLVIQVNGQALNIDDKLRAESKEQVYAERIGNLLALKEKGYELAPLGESKVEDRPVVGVKVLSKGHRDVNLYFDKENGLLLKTEHRALDPMTMQEVSQEKIFSAYKDVNGFKSPTKVVVNRDGKPFIEAEVLEVKHLERLDDSTFEP